MVKKPKPKTIENIKGDALWGLLMETMFNRIGNKVLKLARFREEMGYFRFTKKDSNSIIQTLIELGFFKNAKGKDKIAYKTDIILNREVLEKCRQKIKGNT
jgi:hypothetical protein